MVSGGHAELIGLEGHQLRLGPWHGHDDVAYLAPLGAPDRAAVQLALQRIRALSFERIITSAVAEQDIGVFVELGFEEHERLHLLAHELLDVEPVSWRATRRARPADRAGVLDIDRAAFEPFWRLDDEGLSDALTATPVSRYRVTVAHGAPTGYAVFGLAGRRGYLQRLAVHPEHWGRGLASLLIRDGLRWLVRRHATSALVNTQTRNEHALQVYLRHGFVLQPYQLVVLTKTVEPSGRPSS